jgi:hypothetical protein
VYAIIYSPGGRLSPGLSFIGGRLPFNRKSSSVFFFGLGLAVFLGSGTGLAVDWRAIGFGFVGFLAITSSCPSS